MFYGLNNFIKRVLPKRLFYRSLIIVAAPMILLQIIITVVFFDSLWIKANKGMTRSLVGEVKTLYDAYKHEISDKKFVINIEQFKNPIKTYKSAEIIYGLRNFIGNANKFSKKKVEIFLSSNKKGTEITIRDDGPGFPKDLIDKHRLGEPYIRTVEQANISQYGLGLGTFIGKTLLEKNFANINFRNSKETGGAEVIIKWKNNDLTKI